jgi:hypothetical protein
MKPNSRLSLIVLSSPPATKGRRAIPRTLEAQMLGRFTKLPPSVTPVIALALVAVLGSGCGSSGGASSSSATRSKSASRLAPIHGAYSPSIDPANFVSTVDNRYWPLKPGTGFHYKGVRGTTPQTDDEIVTHQTKRILGVKCTVVRDTVSEYGRPIERTFDWYAQDKEGNVWYMGEDALELQHGRFVKASDSWESGVHGAKPGIIMPGNPQRGDSYRQEYYPPGEALDQARVLGYSGTVKVPYGAFKRSLVTSEFSPLEPQTENKYYVAGVGEIQERVVKGHHEQFQLVSVTH